MSQQTKPFGAPNCWGLKYQDGDLECRQCRFNDTCRPVMMARLTAPPPAPQPTQQLVPLPAKPWTPTFQPQQPTQIQVHRAPSPPPSPPTVYQTSYPTTYQPPQPQAPVQPYYQQQSWASLPDPQNPNPLTPMMRPGAPAPAYYFCQYQGETTLTRLGKNALLRAAESIFGEFMFFFRHWTWPPRT